MYGARNQVIDRERLIILISFQSMGVYIIYGQIDNTEFSLGGKLENYITYITTL